MYVVQQIQSVIIFASLILVFNAISSSSEFVEQEQSSTPNEPKMEQLRNLMYDDTNPENQQSTQELNKQQLKITPCEQFTMQSESSLCRRIKLWKQMQRNVFNILNDVDKEIMEETCHYKTFNLLKNISSQKIAELEIQLNAEDKDVDNGIEIQYEDKDGNANENVEIKSETTDENKNEKSKDNEEIINIYGDYYKILKESHFSLSHLV